jgi:DNA-binding protein HU-beta
VEAERRFNDVLDLITDELYAGNDVKLNHFFNFFVKELAAKNGKNPVTKEDMVIPKVKTIRVRMTKPVKDAIQGKKA